MKRKTLTRSLILIIGVALNCTSFAAPKVYFNHNESKSFTEPYRHIHRSGENLEEVLLSHIKTAKSSIYVAVQELRLPRIALALVEKAKAGVDVRVILENSYNFTIAEYAQGIKPRPNEEDDPTHAQSTYSDLFAFVDLDKDGRLSEEELMQRDALYILRENGIPIIDDTADGSRGSGLMHHKFLVVDGKKTIVSSANFTPSCIFGDALEEKSRGNVNAMMSVNSIRMAKIFTEEFMYMWGGEDGKSTKLFGIQKPYRGRQKVKLGDTTLTIQFSPTSRWKMWSETVNGLIAERIAQAKKSVHMALFVFSEQRLIDLLQERTQKYPQMDVRLLIEPKFAYREYSELLDIWGLALRNEKCKYPQNNNPWKVPYMTAGAANRPAGDVFHHKFAVIDSQAVIFGSQNWSESANTINEETLVVIENESVAKAFEKEHQRAYSLSRLGPTSSLLKKIQQMDELCAGR